MKNEAVLLRALQQKQRGALETAIELYTPYLSTVLYNLAGRSLSREDTEEIVSDVFMSLWERAAQIDLQKGTMRAYMAAVARNAALRRLQKNREHVPLDELELAGGVGGVDEGLSDDELWGAVMALGEPDNEIFVRHYKYGQRLIEIAKATALPLSTVKSKLARGREKLRKLLADAEEGR